jgi:DNA modification methylase
MNAPRTEQLSDSVTLYLGDCREILPSLPKVDAVVTDPPYGLGIAANPVRQRHEKLDWDNDVPPPCVNRTGEADSPSIDHLGRQLFPASAIPVFFGLGQSATRGAYFVAMRESLDEHV